MIRRVPRGPRWHVFTLPLLTLTLAACALPPAVERDATAGSSPPAAAAPTTATVPPPGATPAQRLYMLPTLRHADARFVPGNRAELTLDGPDTYRSMFEDIDAASEHIHVETYILDDGVVGSRLAERLIASRERGVEVRLLIDGFGSAGLAEDFTKRLERAGVHLQTFHPIDPTEAPPLWRLANRDHRKVLIVDGRIAYTGGINFSDEYRHESELAERAETFEDTAWRDTQLRIVGPVVRDFQRSFVHMWNRSLPAEDHLHADAFVAPTGPVGDMHVAVVTSQGGDSHEYDIYATFLAAIEAARERIWITQGYFVPPNEFYTALIEARARGVDVKLLLAGNSDAPIVTFASRARYDDLLEAGIQIFERDASMLHAKTMVIDGVWSSIGSANIDFWSLAQNYELNAVIVDRAMGERMERIFNDDLADAAEIHSAQWSKRPLLDRVREWVGLGLKRWL